MSTPYPITLSVDYPDRSLNRLTTFFRIIVAIPIIILLASVSAWSWSNSHNVHALTVAGSGGLLFFGPLLMILFRQKYPRWWFDWNLELMRFATRVGVYLSLMDDSYPATDNNQSVHLNIKYPDASKDLNRWLPLIKWLLAIPHYFVLFFLDIAAVFTIIAAWFNILFSGNYPKSSFEFLVKVMRWNLRVLNYAFVLTTDEYPPFSLNERE